MWYLYPHYYKQFRCIASDCPDTCCAGWEIMIDRKSLERYKNVPGPLGNRLYNSVDWRRHAFRQYEGRCEFLNEEGLCDLYTEMGEDGFCRTCRVYPRHIEEFEGIREVSLCLSCIEAARIILGTEEPVRFLSKETGRREEYENFDFFLYTKLADTRDLVMEILQNRTADDRVRMGLCLSLAHDLQRRIRDGKLYETDQLLERYRRPDRERRFADRLADCGLDQESRYRTMTALYEVIEQMAALKPEWPGERSRMRAALYENGKKSYDDQRQRFLRSKAGEGIPLLREQLMVYWVFAYFNGAVYDEDAYGKMKFAVACTLLIEDMCQAVWREQSGTLCQEDIVDTAHKFSREVEHADENRGILEEALTHDARFSIRALLCAVEG